MTEPTDDAGRERPSEVGDGLYSRSVRAARGGRYAESAQLLDAAVAAEECTPIEALDLRARICAQQGLHLEAERLWLRASELSKTPGAFDAPLRRLRGMRVHSSRPAAMAAAVLFLILGVLVWQGDARIMGHLRSSSDAVHGEMARHNQASEDAVRRIEARVEALSDAVSEQERRLSRRIDVLRLEAMLLADSADAGSEDLVLARLLARVPAPADRTNSSASDVLRGIAKDQIDALRHAVDRLREQLAGVSKLVEELQDRRKAPPGASSPNDNGPGTGQSSD